MIRISKVFVSLLVLAMIAGCASTGPTASPDASAVLDERDHLRRELISRLVSDVRRAMTALNSYYFDSSLRSIQLESVTVKLATSYTGSKSGELKLLVISGGGSKALVRDGYVLLTLDAPNQDEIRRLIGADKDGGEFAAVAKLYREEGKKIDCNEKERLDAPKIEGERPFWKTLANLAIAGANGFVCSSKANGLADVDLQKLEVSAGLKATFSAKLGLELETGPLTLGASASSEEVNGSSIIMKFSRPSAKP